MVQGVHAKFGLDPSSSLGGEWRQTNKQTDRHTFLFLPAAKPTGHRTVRVVVTTRSRPGVHLTNFWSRGSPRKR